VYLDRIASRFRVHSLTVLLTLSLISAMSLVSAVPAQTITEPASTGIFYLLGPTGNQVSLEYIVGKSTFVGFQVQGETSPIRLPATTNFRFVVRLPPGADAKAATVQFSQFEVKGGFRRFLKITAEKPPKNGTDMAVVPFDTASVGSSSITITPRSALRPGEYCMVLGKSQEVYCFGVDASPAPSGPPQEVAQASGKPAMTNADVVKLVSAGLSAEIVSSSIRQASAHNFDLSVDSLIVLKKGNVPDAVISTMQQFSGTGANAGGATPTGSSTQVAVGPIPDSSIPQPKDNGVFYFVNPDGRLTRLEIGKPDLVGGRTTLVEGNQLFYKLFGAKSPVRTTNGMVTIVVKMAPVGTSFLDKAFDDKSGNLSQMQIRRWEPVEGQREARFNARPPRRGSNADADPGAFDSTITKLGDNFYKIAPVDPLVPGEYCMGLHRLPTDVERLYCFGVDPAK